MTWMRRIYEAITSPLISLLDAAVVVIVVSTLLSSDTRWVKAVVVVGITAVGTSSFVFRTAWWKPKPVCEVRNCPNRTLGQTVATNVDGELVYRRVCQDHWMIWRGPGVGSPEAAIMRDQMVVMWGWPGTAWARS